MDDSERARFTVLGPVEVHAADGRVLTLDRRRERCLLGILLLEADRIVPVDRLCELLWDEDPPDRAHQTVRSHVSRIRALLSQASGDNRQVKLASRHGGYVLTVDHDAVDAHRFRRLLAQATGSSDLHVRQRLLWEALALWRGPVLAGAVSDRQRQRLCVELEELRLRAVEESLATGLELGRHGDLLPELARLNAEHPVRERLVELQMLALYRDGRAAEALDTYTRARVRLADELGLAPSPSLQRVHQAILRGEPIATTQPSAAPQIAAIGVTPAQLPADLAGFTGRREHLRQLDSLLSNRTTAVVISAIAGTAGVGKTALAVHWAHLVRHRFPDGQLYVNLHGFDPTTAPTAPHHVIRRFLDALQVPVQRIPASAYAQIDLYRSLLADRRMLVILDNARDSEQVRPLLPGASGCFVLVTSRNRLTGLVAIDGAQPLSLDLPTSDEARQLLAARLGTDRVSADLDAADDLIALCARLPLALAVAAAHAAIQPDAPLATVAARLRATGSAFDALTAGDTATDIRAVFTCSYRALNPDVARLFRLLGLHPGPDLSTAAAASLAGVPTNRIRPMLAELIHAHLISEPIPGRFTFHDLLRSFALEQAHSCDRDADRCAATLRLLDHYLRTSSTADAVLNPHRERVALGPPQPGTSPEPLTDARAAQAWLAVERPALLATIGAAIDGGFDRQAQQLAFTLTASFDYQGRWSDLFAAQSAALIASCRLGDQAAEARAHRDLAFAHARLGQYDDAHEHFQRAVDLFVHLGDDIQRAHTYRLHCFLFERQGHHQRALDHARQALDLYRTADHRGGEAAALNLVGWYHAVLSEYDEAVAYCQKAVAAQQALPNERGESAAWDSLGYAYHQLGQYGEAIACYARAVELRGGLDDRHKLADTLRHLGSAYNAAGKPDDARRSWQHALTIFVELDHPDTNAVRAQLDSLDPRNSAGDAAVAE